MKQRRWSALLGAVVAAGLMWAYHDVGWYPPDDGNYMHVAARMADGEVLFRDVSDIHAGYINFVHMAALNAFGEQFVSLRYPLIAVAGVQGAIIGATTAALGFVPVVLASLSVVAGGMLLFPGPSANWYASTCLLLALFVCARHWTHPWRCWVLLGALVGMAGMFRQLTGAILGLLVVVHCAARCTSRPGMGEGAAMKWAVAGAVMIASLVCAIMLSDLVAVALFGIPAAGATMIAVSRNGLGSAELSRRLILSAFGVTLGVLPMATYLTLTGTWSGFVQDAVLGAIRHPTMPLFEARSYGDYLRVGLVGIVTLRPGTTITSLFWVGILLAPWMLVLRLWRTQSTPSRLEGVVCALGAISGLTMAYVPSPLYIGAAFPAMLFAGVASGEPRRMRQVFMIAAAMLAITNGLVWQVGWPRGPEWLWGNRERQEQTTAGEPVRLVVHSRMWKVLQDVDSAVTVMSNPTDPLYVFPSHAELYTLTGRRNPTRHYALRQGVTVDGDITPLLRELQQGGATLIVMAPPDQWVDINSVRLCEWLVVHSMHTASMHGFEFFKIASPESAAEDIRRSWQDAHSTSIKAEPRAPRCSHR